MSAEQARAAQPTPKPLRGTRGRDWALAGLLAVALVAALDLVTNSMPRPLYDGWFYVQMSIHGLDDFRRLVAPFAYRPAVPMLVGVLCEYTSIPVLAGYYILTRVAAVLQLVLVFGLASAFGASRWGSLVILGAVSLSLFHVKYPLYFYTLIDVEAYCLALVATWMLFRRRFCACLLASSAGIFFKEFLIVPGLLLLYELVREQRSSPAFSSRLPLLLASAALLLVCAAAPRLLIPIRESEQFFDPLHHPGDWAKLYTAPLDWARDLNIPYSLASYWLPTLLLATRTRLRRVWEELTEIRHLLVMYLVLVVVFALYGGTNIMVFVAYTLPLQVVVLARLLGPDATGLERAFMLLAVLIFNRALLPIPELGHDEAVLNTHMDFYGGWSSRVSMATALRSAELALWLAGAYGLRALLARRSERAAAS